MRRPTRCRSSARCDRWSARASWDPIPGARADLCRGPVPPAPDPLDADFRHRRCAGRAGAARAASPERRPSRPAAPPARRRPSTTAPASRTSPAATAVTGCPRRSRRRRRTSGRTGPCCSPASRSARSAGSPRRTARRRRGPCRRIPDCGRAGAVVLAQKEEQQALPAVRPRTPFFLGQPPPPPGVEAKQNTCWTRQCFPRTRPHVPECVGGFRRQGDHC